MFDLFKPPLYIRLSPFRLTVRNVKTGEFISEVPEIAIFARAQAQGARRRRRGGVP
jgi:rod shape-determining protein MreB